MSKKALPVIIITVCLLFAGCKAPADQEQKNNTETAVLSTETQEEDWKQVHSTQKDLEKLPQKIQKIFSDNQTAFCTLWRSQMRFRAVALRSITAARF